MHCNGLLVPARANELSHQLLCTSAWYQLHTFSESVILKRVDPNEHVNQETIRVCTLWQISQFFMGMNFAKAILKGPANRHRMLVLQSKLILACSTEVVRMLQQVSRKNNFA